MTVADVQVATADDAAAVAALERDAVRLRRLVARASCAEGVLGPGADDALPGRATADERRRLRRGQHRRRRRRAAADRGRRRPTGVPASPRGLLARVEHEARPDADRLLLEVREDNHAALRVLRRRGFTEIDRRPRYYARRHHRGGPAARRRPDGACRMSDEPLVLGIETSCDETGVGIVRGHTLLADAVASQRRGARPLRRRRARGRQPRPPRGDGADHRAGLRDRRHPRCTTSTRSR